MNSRAGGLLRADQVRKQGGAVDVAPLKVVDRQDQRRSLREPFQSSRSPAKVRRRSSCWSGISAACRGGPTAIASTPCSTGNDPRQERHVLGQQAPRLAGRQPLQIPRQRVDQAVQRLVRDRFPLVAAPREHDRLVARQSARRGTTGSSVVLPVPVRPKTKSDTVFLWCSSAIRLSQDLTMPRPADQRERAEPAPGTSTGSGRRPPSRRDDLAARRPLRGGPGPAASTQSRTRSSRQALRPASPGEAGRLVLLGRSELLGRTAERKLARSAPRRASRRRCTSRSPCVTGGPAACSGDMWPTVPTISTRRSVPPDALEVGRQPEIEQDDAALARDQDIRRLDVPVQLSGLVQRLDALGELPRVPRAAAARQSGSWRPAAGLDSVELRRTARSPSARAIESLGRRVRPLT